LKRIPNRKILDLDGKLMDLTKDEQRRVPWLALYLDSAVGIRLLCRSLPLENFDELEAGDSLMKLAREAGESKADTIQINEEQYKNLMGRLNEYGPKVFGYNAKPIKAAFEDVLEDTEKPEGASEDGQAGGDEVAVGAD
jgi:hypothetical protein